MPTRLRFVVHFAGCGASLLLLIVALAATLNMSVVAAAAAWVPPDPLE